MADAEVHQLAAAYALNALDESERRDFEAHLEACETCRTEVGSYGDVTAALALLAAPADPPAELRSRILAQARGDGNVVQLRPRRASRLVPALAAAAAVAAIGLGIWAASLSSSLTRERDARRARESALAVLADPTARRIPLRGRRGVLAVAADGRAALAVLHLPRAPSGKAYEAWVIGGKKVLPAGTFDASRAATVFRLGRAVPTSAQVAVTIERKGGVSRPSGHPLITASV